MDDDRSFRVREINPRKDLGKISELIEQSFHAFLDPDGKRFVDRLQKMDDEMRGSPLSSLLHPLDFSLAGYVAVTPTDEIIGTTHLFPCRTDKGASYLIANVCVAPAYRRHKVATALMREALEYAKKRYASRVYLQVRMETPEVVGFYQQFDFKKDASRVSWVRPSQSRKFADSGSVRLTPMVSAEREDFERRFFECYPIGLLWNLNYTPEVIQTGWFAWISRKMQRLNVRFHRVADQRNQPICWIIWQESESFTDTLWFVPADGASPEALIAALRLVSDRYTPRKAVQVNVAAGSFADVLPAAGFFVHNRLIWMSKRMR